jgi:hypothetical protein
MLPAAQRKLSDPHASDAVFLARPLFLFGHRRVSAGAGGALLFPQGLSARNLSKPGWTILQQHNLGVLETHDSNLQWYAAPWQSQAKARSESSIVLEFFPPLVLALVGLRRVSPRSQDLKPSYPIFAWGSNCHFSNQIDPPSQSAPSSTTTNSIPQPFQSSTRLLHSALANSQAQLSLLTRDLWCHTISRVSRRGLDHSRSRLIRSSRII